MTILKSLRKSCLIWRNGTGTKVVRQIEEELRKQGDVEMTYLYLADVDLKMCRGCFECISKGEDRCPLKDDRVGIEGMMDRSDGIILVSPGYVQNVSGLMKNFMDRFAYTNHRPRFFGKQMMLVANGGALTRRSMRCALPSSDRTSSASWRTPSCPGRPRPRETSSRR
jgi:multimeric flavodoxin WrbA